MNLHRHLIRFKETGRQETRRAFQKDQSKSLDHVARLQHLSNHDFECHVSQVI